MIGFENADSSFFILQDDTSNPITGKVKDAFPGGILNGRVVSFQVDEEIGKITSGSITFMDDNNIFSGTLKTGATFLLYWGYRKLSSFSSVVSIMQSLQTNLAAGAIGSMGLRCIRGTFMSPNGSGNNNGDIRYTATFYGQEHHRPNKQEQYSKMAKKFAIQRSLNDLGVDLTNIFMDWDSENDMILPSRPWVRTGGIFQWLSRIAKDNKVVFRIANDPKGVKLALWVDSHKMDSAKAMSFTTRVTGAMQGNTATYAYKYYAGGAINGLNDVASYTWSQNVGENGTGDSVNIVYQPNGTISFYRQVAGTRTITAYSINADNIKKFTTEVLKGKSSAMPQIANVIKEDFDQYRARGFIQAQAFTTAPEGFGYKMTCEVPVGNPGLSAAQVAKMRGAFPISFTSDGNTFYNHKVTHKFENGRYSNTVEIADCFTITGGSLIGTFKGQM